MTETPAEKAYQKSLRPKTKRRECCSCGKAFNAVCGQDGIPIYMNCNHCREFNKTMSHVSAGYRHAVEKSKRRKS